MIRRRLLVITPGCRPSGSTQNTSRQRLRPVRSLSSSTKRHVASFCLDRDLAQEKMMDRSRSALRNSTSTSSAEDGGYFHSSRPSEWEQAGDIYLKQSRTSQMTQSLYASRYLPSMMPPSSTLLQSNNSFSEALRNLDADAAWATRRESQTSSLDLISPELEKYFWWCIAAQPSEVRKVPVKSRGHREAEMVTITIQRLLELSQNCELDPMQVHRLLYLLLVRLESIRREFQKSSKTGRPSVETPRVEPAIWHAVDKLIQNFRDRSKILDPPLLLRLIHQLAIYGRPSLALAFYQEQCNLWRKGKFEVRKNEGWSDRPPCLDAHAAEPLLEAIALSPLRKVTAGDNKDLDSGQDLIEQALAVIAIATDDEVALHRRPLSSWMHSVPESELWSLLPRNLARAARRRLEAWSLAVDSERRPPTSRKIDEDVRHLLSAVIAHNLALRGDLRVCLTLQDLNQATPTSAHVDDVHLREALLIGISRNITKLLSIHQWDRTEPAAATERTLRTSFDALEMALSLLTARSYSGGSLLHATFDIAPILRSARRVLSLALDSGFDFDRSQWKVKVRQLSALLLSENHRMEQISFDAHASLFRLHALLADHGFAQEIWDSLRARHENQGENARSRLPTMSPEFTWLLRRTVERGNQADAMYSFRLYLDALINVEHKSITASFEKLCHMVLRLLSKHKMMHEFRHILEDLRARSAPLSADLASVIIDAFREPNSAYLEQNLASVEAIANLFMSTHNTATCSGIEHSPDPPIPTLPLYIFSTTLMQGTSQWLSAVWWRFRPRLDALFAQFLETLNRQIEEAARIPLTNAKSRQIRILEETVRQGFNSAMRIGVDFPVLPLFRPAQSAREQLDVLLGLVHTQGRLFKVNGARHGPASLADDLRPVRGNEATHDSMSTSGQARLYVLRLVSFLSQRLEISGDSETWSLRLLAWMLPSSKEELELGLTPTHRLEQALKVWHESLSAEYDFSRTAALKPWSRLTPRKDERTSDGQSDPGIDQEHRSWETLVHLLPRRSSSFNLSQGSDQRTDTQSKVEELSCSTAVAHPSRDAVPRSILMRSRVTARFMLILGLERGEPQKARQVYDSWQRSADDYDAFKKQEIALKAATNDDASVIEPVWSKRNAAKNPPRPDRVDRGTVELAHLIILIAQKEEVAAYEVWKRLPIADRISLAGREAGHPHSKQRLREAQLWADAQIVIRKALEASETIATT